MSNTQAHSALETRAPAEREAALMAALPAHLRAAMAVPAMAESLAGIDPGRVQSRAALSQLPVTRKHELFEKQKARHAGNVFGGFSALGWTAPHDFDTGLGRTVDWYLANRAWWEGIRAARYAGQRLGQGPAKTAA